MPQLKLLQNYKTHTKGEIIDVITNEANRLIAKGIARQATNRDFLVKLEFGAAKAFSKPPSKRKVVERKAIKKTK